MKKYLYKSAWFVVPIFLMVIYTEMYYDTNKGDLIRLGFVADTFNYNKDSTYKANYAKPELFTRLSDLDLTRKHKFKFLVIGDSFSDQLQISYYNYMANADSILYVDRYINDNPLETIQGLMAGGLFKHISVDYIILQSVERDVVSRRVFDENKLITTDSIALKINKNAGLVNKHNEEDSGKDILFNNKNLKFTRNNILYLIDDNAFYSETYMVKTTKNLFEANKNVLLFYKHDIKCYDENSDIQKIEALNARLNKLSDDVKAKANAKLIVIVAPDKFGLYYDYIQNKEKYKYSGFFDKFNKLPKNYINIPASDIMSTAIKSGERDIYMIDDTHWSPLATQKIAAAIDSKIK